MTKEKFNLSMVGTHNIDIIDRLKENNYSDEFIKELEDVVDNDYEFFKILWREFDLVFNRNSRDSIDFDIHNSDSYEEGSTFYNFVLEKIIKDFHNSMKGDTHLASGKFIYN